MSYANFDHAAWVERNNAAGRRTHRKPSKDKYGSVIGYHDAPEHLTEFQAKAVDILGMVFGGIYNAPICWNTADWSMCGGRGLSVVATYCSGFSTFDFNRLTMFVFLCHEARIRGDIEPAGPRGLRLTFVERQATGGIGERHPNLDEAVASFRQYLPADHRIIFRDRTVKTEAA